MFNPYAFTESQILIFGLLLLRMFGFVFSSAIFGAPVVTTPLKILFSLVLAVVLYPTIKVPFEIATQIGDNLVTLAVREIVLGLTLGFLTRLFFFAITMVGDMTSVSIGLGAAQLYNPMMGSSGNALEQFYMILGTLLFFLLQAHHIFLSALASSFDLIPLAKMSFNYGAYGEMAYFGQKIIEVTVKMCAPVLVTILIVNVAMGILGRAIPQMNVLVTSMPVTIGIGMALMFITLPLLILEMNGLLDITATHLMKVLKAL